MKKLLSFIMVLLILLLVGCSNQDAENDLPLTSNKILKAWIGEFSEKKLKEAINEYQNNYSNIVFENVGEVFEISFEVDFEAVSCSVTRLSRTSKDDIDVELYGYIDLFIETNCEDNVVTVHTGWWHGENDSWVKSCPVWSYLILVKDASGTEHYYYFRTDYSAFLSPSNKNE